MVFVNLDENGQPAPHGRTRIRYADEAFARYREDSRPVPQGAVAVEEERVASRAEVDSLH
jgi:hypothetical protein